eukprot:14300795-Alexandrium_andersonii.AAC.1
MQKPDGKHKRERIPKKRPGCKPSKSSGKKAGAATTRGRHGSVLWQETFGDVSYVIAPRRDRQPLLWLSQQPKVGKRSALCMVTEAALCKPERSLIGKACRSIANLTQSPQHPKPTPSNLRLLGMCLQCRWVGGGSQDGELSVHR